MSYSKQIEKAIIKNFSIGHSNIYNELSDGDTLYKVFEIKNKRGNFEIIIELNDENDESSQFHINHNYLVQEESFDDFMSCQNNKSQAKDIKDLIKQIKLQIS